MTRLKYFKIYHAQTFRNLRHNAFIIFVELHSKETAWDNVRPK